MSSHIVYVVESPLSGRDRQRLGIDEMLARGFHVTVLDIGVMSGSSKDHDRQHYKMFVDISLREVRSRGDLAEEIETLMRSDLIICCFGSGYVFPQTYSVYRAIAKSGTPYMLLMSNYVPLVEDQPDTLAAKLSSFRARFLRASPAKSILARIPPRLIGLRPASFVVYGGCASQIPRRLIDETTTPIFAHAMDYDFYLDQKDRTANARPLAVFIDQNFGYHPDAVSLGSNGVVNVENYYPDLRRFFDRVENDFGLEVVIAAHPRADYSDKPNLFGDRQILHNETASLIPASRLVIAAYSTATALAILHGKPVLLHTTRELSSNHLLFGFIDSLAERLGVTPISIDAALPRDLVSAATVDVGKRGAYIADFIKSPGSEQKRYWEIVIEGLATHGVLQPDADRAVVPMKSAAGG